MSHDHDKGEHKPHVLPIKIYLGVWVGLLILSFVTVQASYMDFGVMNLAIAMAIATVKAALVVMFFMHLKYDEPFNVIVFFSSIAFLGIFVVFTLADTVERGSVDPIEADVIEPVPGRPDLMDGTHGHRSPDTGHDEPGAADDDHSGDDASGDAHDEAPASDDSGSDDH